MNAHSREIGSEYWDIPLCEKENNLFVNVQWFLSGRSALSYVICDIKKKYDVKTAALPFWCCDSMIIPFVNAGIEVRFYDKAVPECDILLTMEYFGFIRNKALQFNGIIIYDVTHSLFSPDMGIKRVPAKDEYFFGSLRKWAGFKTGGFAGRFDGEFVTQPPKETNHEYVNIRTTAMEHKNEYLFGSREDKEYLNLFNQAEEMLDSFEISKAYEEDVEKAGKLDLEFIKNRRRVNAKILLEEVSDIALFKEVNDDDVPLFLPIVLPDDERNALRKYLIEHNVFCPIHWPYTKWHGEKKDIFDTELSLICDQRYDRADMEYICSLIREFRR